MRKKIMTGLAFLTVFLAGRVCCAETIYLKNGKVVQGQVVQKTGSEVKVNVQGLTLTYFADEIARIEGAPPQGAANQAIHQTAKPQTPALVPKQEPLKKFLPGAAVTTAAPSGPTDESLSSLNKQALVLALIETSGARDNMNQIFSQTIAQSTPEDAEKLKQLFDVNEVILELVPVYEKYFDENELKEIITFYKNPGGRKLLKATPLIMQDSTGAILAYLQRKIEAAGLAAPAQGQEPQGQGVSP